MQYMLFPIIFWSDIKRETGFGWGIDVVDCPVKPGNDRVEKRVKEGLGKPGNDRVGEWAREGSIGRVMTV